MDREELSTDSISLLHSNTTTLQFEQRCLQGFTPFPNMMQSASLEVNFSDSDSEDYEPTIDYETVWMQ
jgi:hypothetical protein